MSAVINRTYPTCVLAVGTLVVGLLVGCSSSTGGVYGFGEITAKDVQEIRRIVSRWEPTTPTPGAAAIVNLPTDAEESAAVTLSDNCAARTSPTYASKMGLSPIKLTSSKQDIEAKFVDDRYEITGFIPEAFYDTDDEALEVSHTPSGTSVSVSAPPAIADVNAVIGEPDGLATEVRVADGTFTDVVIFVSTTNGAMPVDITCVFSHDELRLEAGVRIGPMVDSTARDRIQSMGLTTLQVIVSIDNQVMSDALFPEYAAIPVRAGRAVSINGGDLTVATPGMCAFPTIVPLDSAGLGKVCFSQAPPLMECTVTSGDCPAFETSFDFHLVNGERYLSTGVGLQLASTTHGMLSQVSGRVTDLPDATTITVEAANFNGNTFAVSFSYAGAQVTVENLTVQ